MKLDLLQFPTEVTSDGKFENNFEGTSYRQCNEKFSSGMTQLLYDNDYEKKDVHYYDFYLDMGRDDLKEVFRGNNVRYDVIYMEGKGSGDEFIKTSGHFHKKIHGKDISYPEIYQVVQGRAVFVLAKVDDWEKEEPMVVNDCIIVEVNAGETVVVPPNYGHCAVNITEEPMIFIDLISIHSDNDYASVKRSRGMCCYILKDGESYKVEKNNHYIFKTDIRLISPIESLTLGIKNNHSIYADFLERPELYSYLNQPFDYLGEMDRLLAII